VIGQFWPKASACRPIPAVQTARDAGVGRVQSAVTPSSSRARRRGGALTGGIAVAGR
jgi:hypothetical protein